MLTPAKPGAYASPLSFWLRWVALVLVLFASCAQAAHVHGDWLPHHDAQVAAVTDAAQLAGDEASCPLCVAMHSALIARSTLQATVQVPVTSAAVEVISRGSSPDWHFILFSRPPPSVV